METVEFFRVGHIDNRAGPFYNNAEVLHKWYAPNYQDMEKYPAPQWDKKLCHKLRAVGMYHLIYGTDSREQLTHWFPVNVLPVLLDTSYRIFIFRVPKQFVLFGEAQCAVKSIYLSRSRFHEEDKHEFYSRLDPSRLRSDGQYINPQQYPLVPIGTDGGLSGSWVRQMERLRPCWKGM